MIITKDLDSNLIRLINVEKSLYHLYRKMEDTNNKDQYLEYLKVTTEVEDRILNDIHFTKENSIQLFKRFSYLITENDTEEEISCILDRINNYLERRFFSIPFTSINNDENKLIISNSARCDYICNQLFLLGNEIEKEENLSIKKVLKVPFYQLCYRNKTFEHALVNPLSMSALNSRKRCINFGHEKRLVDKGYKEHAFDIMDIILDNLLQYPDVILNNYNDTKLFQKVNLIQLKGAAYLLHSSELFDTYQAQYHVLTEESSVFQKFYRLTAKKYLIYFKRFL